MEEIKNTTSDRVALKATDFVKNIMLTVEKMTASANDREYTKHYETLKRMCGSDSVTNRALEIYSRNKNRFSEEGFNWSDFALENKSLSYKVAPSIGQTVQPKTVKKNTALTVSQSELERLTKERERAKEEARQNNANVTNFTGFSLVNHNAPMLTESAIKDNLRGVRTFAQLESTDKEEKETFNTLKAKYHDITANCKTTDDFKSLMLDSNFAEVLEGLSCAVARSVLRKIYDPQRGNAKAKAEKAKTDREAITDSGCNKEVLKMYHAINADMKELSEVRNRSAKGEGEIIVHDPIREGYNLVSTAKTAIIDWSMKQLERGHDINLDSAEEHTHINKRVFIQDDPVFITENKEPISLAFKAVRQETINNRSVNVDPKSKYVYIEELVHNDSEEDTEGEETVIYRRAKANYLTVSGCDIESHNGFSTTSITASANELERLDNMIQSLNLTKKQSVVLEYSIRGYGIKAIATKLNCSHQNIAKVKKAIEVKAIKAGIFSDELLSTVGKVESESQRKKEIAERFMDNMRRAKERQEREEREEREERDNNLKTFKYVRQGKVRQIFTGYWSLGCIEDIAVNMVCHDGYSIESTMLYIQYAFHDRMTERAKEIVYNTLRGCQTAKNDLQPTLGKRLDKIIADRFSEADRGKIEVVRGVRLIK